MKKSGEKIWFLCLLQACSAPTVAPPHGSVTPPSSCSPLAASPPGPLPSASTAPAPEASSDRQEPTAPPIEPLGLAYFPEAMRRVEDGARSDPRGPRTAVVLFAAPGTVSPDVGLQGAEPPRFLPVACVIRGQLAAGLPCAEAMPPRARVRVSSPEVNVIVEVERSRRPFRSDETSYPAPFEPSCCFYNGCRGKTIPYRPLASGPPRITLRALFAVWPPDADVSFEPIEPGPSLPPDEQRALEAAVNGATILHSFEALQTRGASIQRAGRDLELFLSTPSGWRPTLRSPGSRWMAIAATDLDGDQKPELYVLDKPQNDYGLTVLEVGTEQPLHKFNCGNI